MRRGELAGAAVLLLLAAGCGSCLSGLPGCTTGNTTPFTTAVVACTTTLSNGLSPACE
ncbi:MAG TPA: hypothetical protein VFI53_00765 [Myxococcaceae bacterium]|nr:hypothetical protein [Myxococcaceae bacterium]